MNYEGPVRRTDLYLRSNYLEFETAIYQIENNKFLIHIQNYSGNFEELKKEFNYSIKLIGASVDITEIIPKSYLKVIPNISDSGISKNFEGIPMSKPNLLNLLLSKFPNVYFTKVGDELGKVFIYTAKFEEIINQKKISHSLNEKEKKEILLFLNNLKTPIEFEIIEENVNEYPKLDSYLHHNPVTFIHSSNFRRNDKSEYTKRDEAIWFDKIDSVFESKFKKDDLYFYDSSEYSCYVDFSVFSNIDLRNHLFLFQTIYLTPPFGKSIIGWLKEFKISKNEFLDLISKNRIKMVLIQPEFRYDTNFIQEIFETNPNAIITRRALATLQQIDIVEMSENYILNDINVLKELKSFCSITKDITKINPKFLYDMLVWPIRARRNSFEWLNDSGLFGMASFGVNTAIEKQINNLVNKDLSFEFTTNSSSIHLANSLNATYFPFKTEDGYSDSFYANIMGELLNFYKSATPKNISSFVENKKKINSGILPISPIDIIEVNDYISITELENVLSRDVVFPNSKRLMETLSDLTENERIDKINLYNNEVNKIINKKNKSENAIDLGTNIILDTAGALTGFSAIGSVFTLLKYGGKKFAKTNSLIKTVVSKIEEVMIADDLDKANIHYLTKINRVAKIKRNI